MKAMGGDVKAEIFHCSPSRSYARVIAESNQIELAQFAFGKCALTVPDYFSWISPSWKLILRGHASFLRAQVRSSPGSLVLKKEIKWTLFPVIVKLLKCWIPADSVDLNMCNLCEQSLNCCCSVAATLFPSQTALVCAGVRESILTEKKKTVQKRHLIHCNKSGKPLSRWKTHKMKGRTSSCSLFLLCITLGLILHLCRSTANF